MSKKVKPDDLSPDQARAIALMLAGMSQRTVADHLGINEATISRWKHGDPAFIAAYNAGLQSLVDDALAELLLLRQESIRALREIISHQSKSGVVADRRLKAAVAALRIDLPAVAYETDPQTIEGELRRKQRDADLVF